MARKNISTGVENVGAVIDLGEDDDIVKEVTTKTVVGRRKRLAVESVPPAVAGGAFEIEPDETIIDVEDADTDDDEPEYGENSLAALYYDESNESLVDNKFCTVVIRRNPDSMNDSFRNPCGAVTKYPPLRNIELAANRMDIEDKVRAENGGGHYFFQMYINGRLGPSWKATLSDDPRAIAAALSPTATTQPAASNAPPPVPVDPLDTLIENLDKFAKLKTVFGGGDKTEKEIRMEFEIAELRREIEAAKNAPAERKSERLTLFEAAMTAGAGNPIQTKILDNLFPSEEKGERHWAAEIFEVAIQNREALFEFAGPLIMSLMGGRQPMQTQPFPQIAPPIQPEPPPAPSGLFAKRTPEPEPESEPGAIATGLFEPDLTAIKADEPEAIDADEEITDAAAAN